jgi:penicillin amidase
MGLIHHIVRIVFGKRLPIVRGKLNVAGTSGPITIARDRWGIPLIDAVNARDGAFAIGFCQGQDRAFQLEWLLRVARGTLAELLGPVALPIDRLSRRIGFHRSAREQYPLLSLDVREQLDSYALGVRAGTQHGLHRLPHEFALLDAKPTPWTPHDTLAITKLLSFTLAANWDAELVRLKVLSTDGPDALRALDPTYPSWHPVISPVEHSAGEAVDRLSSDLQSFFSAIGPGGGSNNWVLSATRTRTGRPILANDPHLSAVLPAHWYLARIHAGENTVAGAVFVGSPTVLVGHNGTACWGLTAGFVDNTDLFIEEVGLDGSSVRQGEDFIKCNVVAETIAVRGSTPVVERILITPRGPIVSPYLSASPHALSLRATWLDPAPIAGFFRLSEARSFQEMQSAFVQWPATSQNVVYADNSGTIGWQLVGRSPLRRKGHGTIPLPGWDHAAGWQSDPVPFEQMPHLVNPPSGFIATANTKPLPEGEGPFLGVDFIDGYRLAAIDKALQARSDWDVADTMRLQLDQRSIPWQEIREFVLSVATVDPDAAQAIELLRDWDGVVSADSPTASVFELFVSEMVRRVAQVKAPQSWRWVAGGSIGALDSCNLGSFRRTGHLVRLLREKPDGWFSHSWNEEIAAALAAAVGFLKQRFGTRPSRWAWGRIRPLWLRHPLSRAQGWKGWLLKSLFNLGPLPHGGDSNVINQAGTLPLDPLASANDLPSLRAVVDVGAWHKSRFVLPGGQSGNPLSPHYGDMLEMWRQGKGVPIAFTAEEVVAATATVLALQSERN